jgi:hypothetical protein
VSALAVARLLVRYRLRSLWNGAWRVPRQRPMRIAWVMLLLAPLGYVAMFANAFSVIAETAAPGAQASVLALVASVLVLSSGLGKMAMNEAVVGGSGENEFLLTRPLSLETLVLARSYAGVVTSFFDALFLLPVLVSASVVWGLGAGGVVMAVLVSVTVQVGLSAAAQAGQILVVRVVPARSRRLVWSALALLAALAMACLWVVATSVFRSPTSLIAGVEAWPLPLRLSPGGWIVAPLVTLARGSALGAVLSLAAPLELTVLALALSTLAVRWAGRAGWEQAGVPWAEAQRAPAPRRAFMTPFTKDWYLIVRDRSRLVTLLALPVIFIGIGIFGSVGWSEVTGAATAVAVPAFSLAAYLAALGPLNHMEAERHAFWLLRVAPVPLWRLLAWKALFWSTIVGSAAVLAAASLLVWKGAFTAGALGTAALAVLGAVTVSWLAVAMASGTASFIDEQRRALGPATLYLFLFVAALYNVVLLRDGPVRWRALLLYGATVALHWIAGVDGAARVFDPEEQRERRVSAADGATLAVLMYVGSQLPRVPGLAESASLAAVIWPAVVLVAAAVYLLRRPGSATGWSLPRALGAGVLAGALGAGLLVGALRDGVLAGALGAVPGVAGVVHPFGPVLALALIRAAAEELVFRGMVQRGLPAGRWIAFAVAAGVALVAGSRPLGAPALLVAVVPGLALAASRRWSSAAAARLVLELFL